MPSLIAWMDASIEDQRRMREIIGLFTEKDSRDELGLGQVRDAISEGLFPGTSVLLTRARYLLFVPWCFMLAEGKSEPLARAYDHERRLITSLRNAGGDDLSGLLGVRVGQALRTLPSTIYWTTLRRYGIVGEEFAWLSDVFKPVVTDELGDDTAPRKRGSAWSSTLRDLPIPEGFPWSMSANPFALSRDEAGWLRDRFLDKASGTLMAHLAMNRPMHDSAAPWLDEAALTVDGDAKALLRQAELFSTSMHGASLLYNLMLAEEYERYGFTSVNKPIDHYRSRLREWAPAASASGVLGWNTDALWARVLGAAGGRIAPDSRRFIDRWVGLVKKVGPAAVATTPEARRLVTDRERQQKGAQRRLGTKKRIGLWAGSAGAGALTYRWGAVRNLLIDVHDGLARDA